MRADRTLHGTLGRAFLAAGTVLLVVLGLAAYVVVRVGSLQDDVTVELYDAITEVSTVSQQLDGTVDLLDAFAESGDTGTSLVLATGVLAQDGAPLPAGKVVVDGHDDPDLRSLHDDAESAVTTWLDDSVEPRVDAVPPGGTTEPVPSARADEEFTAAVEATDAYADELDALRTQELAALERWMSALYGLVVLLVLTVVAASWWLWRTVERRFSGPVAALAADVRRAGTGDHEGAIEVVGSGEVADLARDVEALRSELVHQAAQIQRSSREVERSHALLTRQTAELERSNRDLEQFAYVASHDLQEPLRKVASFTQLLKKRYGGQLDDRADQYIEFAVDGAKRMQRLIQDLLGFSRVGRSGGAREDVDLEVALAAALEVLDDRVRECGAVVTHDPLPVVHGERALLEQLLVNVVGNAVKFRSPDRAPRVHLAVVSGDTHWELVCTDNGIGIDPQYAERVFVIFQRLHAKEVYGGTGIGLAMCKRIVEYHGGRIWIDGVEGGGTAVHWTLAHRYVTAAEEWGREPGDVG
ncbi:phospho-acceptor domain-containing protein [Sediminihabitans luteus]|uniref:histidine kinase n=1 Tax=Sediminihabitans luteus TaxID=1138585 RepID=A0A2M9CCH9_9CELL|nr:ATP-binding protein [Sediminihabitans luteus]PJJ69064.1 phospho-acceptor domain-containing protein [Sediminihabitans luteus]GII99450.1 hypothetical protein Slu03_18280 [Sediminihabitans luteus]